MAHFDQSNADCLVFTYKEGLLSAVAHDLELRVTRFALDVDDATRSVKASFEPDSLKVVGARKNGMTVPGSLSPKDVREIEANIAKDVLQPKANPELRFESSKVTEQAGGLEVKGALFLHGRRKDLSFAVRREGARWVAEVRLQQPDFGIRPYSAMFGTLKIKPEVLVRLSVPAS
ncbi:MAG: YceI family protein [Myxococcaceae bacterium]